MEESPLSTKYAPHLKLDTIDTVEKDIKCTSNWTSSEILTQVQTLPNDTTKLTFIDCNLRNVDFSFFAEFANMRNLQHLTVNGGSLVRFNSMPFLPNLITIYVGVPDFRQWYDPAMTPNLKNVTLAGLAGERYVEHVLATLWFGYWNTLEGLTIKETSLTRVPSVVNDFYRLHSFDLSSNEMLNHLASGTISARSNPHYLSFANCGIISIESGAFQGNKVIDSFRNNVNSYGSYLLNRKLLQQYHQFKRKHSGDYRRSHFWGRFWVYDQWRQPGIGFIFKWSLQLYFILFNRGLCCF